MLNTAPVTNVPGRGRTLRLTFISAVVSLVAAFAAVGSTIPLFNIYRAEDGFTNAGISMTVVAYSAATLTTLLVLGRLSNHLGRQPISIASLVLLLLGCVLLLNVHDIGILITGRLLMGLGAGLASSSLTAYIVDAAPARPAWLASVASSQTVMLGLAVGAIASGALVQFGPWPRDLIFLVVIGLLLLSVGLIAVSPETVTRMPGAWRSLRPRVYVPPRVRHLLPVATAVFLATWAAGAFYQAFVPALVEDQLHTNSPLIVGLVFAAYMGPSVLGAPLGGRFTTTAAQRLGMIAFLAGMIGIITAIATGTLALFIAATIVAGAAQGIAISATTRGLLHGSTLADRAPIFSVIYLLCYSGATIPALIAGQLSHTFSLPQIALGYGALALIATLFTAIAARNAHTDTVENSQHAE
ncbi:Predicted arabinose efflux permease, MFS family [Micromonospora coriariae]|uniref:Predicted arabinose efflux permease, MFS family n=1 Tax=Micromonospora coriariae TaxID=285665 RepID=A0A1C4U5P1_9ACTN|nr:Predicted arabinose efflux permease, MFS family [Micromonospora coriariae]